MLLHTNLNFGLLLKYQGEKVSIALWYDRKKRFDSQVVYGGSII